MIKDIGTAARLEMERILGRKVFLELAVKVRRHWRRELWGKGVASGNGQRVRSLRYGCDADALLALVEPAGPACHTGERTCFFRTLGPASVAVHEAIPTLTRTLSTRARELPEGSY